VIYQKVLRRPQWTHQTTWWS